MITGQDVYKIRRLYDLTQHEMGRIAGVSQSAVFKIENNYMSLKDQTAKRITDRLGITPERLAFIRGIYAELQSSRQAVM